MITHGWCRYNIPEVLKGNMQRPEKSMESSKEVSGITKSLILGKPVENSEVKIMVSSGGMGEAETNEKGESLLAGLDFPDSTFFLYKY